MFDNDCDKLSVGCADLANCCFVSCKYAEYDESNDASLVSVNARFFNDAFPIWPKKKEISKCVD